MPKKTPYLPIGGRPPRLRRPSALPRGPREFARLVETVPQTGPGEPPEDFRSASLGGPGGSIDEWYAYWGLARVMKDPRDPRKGPFTGGIDWAYQSPVLLPGQLVSREAGSDVVDFVVYHYGATTAIRIQSALHTLDVFGEFAKVRARDLASKANLEVFDQIVDVYSYYFIDDPTGQKVCQVMRDAIKGIQWLDPATGGFARQVQPEVE